MAEHYKYITFAGRRKIAVLYQANTRPADIADQLGVTTATIYRELKRWETVGEDGAPILDRNRWRTYNPVIAQQTVQANFRRRGRTPADDMQGGFDGDSV
ncbi:helix-turn-helix domain-containing protein [Oscillospiraceae bacterium 38-13]